jgi:hypothetical protein
MSMFDYDARPVTPVPVLVGTTASRGAYAIRDFLSRNGYPFEWVDAGQPDAVRAVLGVAGVEPASPTIKTAPSATEVPLRSGLTRRGRWTPCATGNIVAGARRVRLLAVSVRSLPMSG